MYSSFDYFGIKLTVIVFRFSIHPSCSLKRVSETLPFTYTGADLYALCSDAMLKAITRKTKKVDEKVAAHNANLKPGQHSITIAQFFDHYSTEDDLSVTVTEADFYSARKELIPSVSTDELAHYERVRRAFESNDSAPKPAAVTTMAPTSAAPVPTQSPPPQLPQPQPLRQQQLSLPNRQRPLSDTSSTLKSPMSPLSPTGQRPMPLRTNSNRSVTKRSDRSTFYFDQGANEEDEEEYVIRTDHLTSNGFGNGDAFARSLSRRSENPSIRSRTKPTSGKFGSATEGDEDMYQ
jgi:peroxin-6